MANVPFDVADTHYQRMRAEVAEAGWTVTVKFANGKPQQGVILRVLHVAGNDRPEDGAAGSEKIKLFGEDRRPLKARYSVWARWDPDGTTPTLVETDVTSVKTTA